MADNYTRKKDNHGEARGAGTGGSFGKHLRDEGTLGREAARAATPLDQLNTNLALATSKTATGPQLRTLANSDSDVIRQGVAANRFAPADLIYEISRTGDPLTRDMARRNPAYAPRTAGEKLRHAFSNFYRGQPVAA